MHYREIKQRCRLHYGETRCTNCGTRSTNQRAGDGCHACLRGFMQPA